MLSPVPTARARRQHRFAIPLVVLALALAASHLAQDWIAGLALLILWGVWELLWRSQEPPVLALAVTFQWLQVTCGVYYYALTGREVEAIYASDYRTMMLLGLGCVVAVTLGLAAGLRWGARSMKAVEQTRFAFPWRTLFVGYLAATVANVFIREFAWTIPGLTQGILAIGYFRLALLFLMYRRLVRPRLRWDWFLGLLGAELALGFSGYFAGFREPLVLAVLALLEAFDSRSVAHWARMGVLAALMLGLGVVWMGIRATYRSEIDEQQSQSRAERLERVGTLSSEWFLSEADSMARDLDMLVERLWAIYYPALAVSRVPKVLPHKNGEIMSSALMHLVTPRILFPEKETLPSDSEMVRQYSGIFVAGSEQNTSIAFGYAAESYLDFGVPLMFVPSLVFGVAMGLLYRAVFHLLRHHELAVGFATVLFWLGLYLFERSWVKTLGATGTLLIYLGGFVWYLDWRLSARGGRRPSRRLP